MQNWNIFQELLFQLFWGLYLILLIFFLFFQGGGGVKQ